MTKLFIPRPVTRTERRQVIALDLREEGFDYALAEAWDMQGELSSSPLLEKLDFVRLAHVSRYWMTRAGAFGSPERCPACGSLCYCSATVYGSLIS